MEYGAQVFSQIVATGIRSAAERAGVELLIRDNEFDADVALANARYFIDQKVDALIQFQGVERVAPVIGHLFAEAGIPCIALEIPQAGAVFFGANNYYAGLLGGRALGTAAEECWAGRFDHLILVEERQTGPFVQSRMLGTIDGVQEILGKLPDDCITRVDGRGTYEEGAQVLCDLTPVFAPGDKLLLTAQNEPSLLGALDALRERGIPANQIIAVIQAATREGCRRMLAHASPVVACIGYFPEKYGEAVIPLLLDWLDGKQPAPAVYTQHVVLDRRNASEYYPEEVPDLPPISRSDGAHV
jgi:ribose transport system substrate-binding protein